MAALLVQDPCVCLASQGGPLAAQHRSEARQLGPACKIRLLAEPRADRVVLGFQIARWPRATHEYGRLAATSRQ